MLEHGGTSTVPNGGVASSWIQKSLWLQRKHKEESEVTGILGSHGKCTNLDDLN